MEYDDLEHKEEKLIIVLSELYKGYDKNIKKMLLNLNRQYIPTDEEREAIYRYAKKIGYLIILPHPNGEVIGTSLLSYKVKLISDVGILFIQKDLNTRYEEYRKEQRKRCFEFLKWIVPTLIALLSWLFVRK